MGNTSSAASAADVSPAAERVPLHTNPIFELRASETATALCLHPPAPPGVQQQSRKRPRKNISLAANASQQGVSSATAGDSKFVGSVVVDEDEFIIRCCSGEFIFASLDEYAFAVQRFVTAPVSSGSAARSGVVIVHVSPGTADLRCSCKQAAFGRQRRSLQSAGESKW